MIRTRLFCLINLNEILLTLDGNPRFGASANLKRLEGFPGSADVETQQELLREAPLRSWESQKLDVPLVCLFVCLSVTDFREFLY